MALFFDTLESKYLKSRRIINQLQVLGRTAHLLLSLHTKYLIGNGLHGKHRVQQFYGCVCIRCRGNMLTESLPCRSSEDTQRTMWSRKLTFIFENEESRLKINASIEPATYTAFKLFPLYNTLPLLDPKEYCHVIVGVTIRRGMDCILDLLHPCK